ncbi:hypothetical protein [Arthrobacter methylotrophus]|uniref:Uncharacterized protein n=1 Tax=Arthrobacter methylotrophus TaxID=121291 RepID=A0ABV5UTE1_9MICC
MGILRWLFEAQIPVAGSVIVLREVPGNISDWAISKVRIAGVFS